MHLSLPILISLLTSTAFTLPTAETNSTGPALEKREKKAYLISYPDNACKGKWNPADKLEGINPGQCYKFSPTHKDPAAGLKINYGSGFMGRYTDSIRFYTDPNCKNSSPDKYWHQDNSGHGEDCLTQKGWVQSIKMDVDVGWKNQNNMNAGK